MYGVKNKFRLFIVVLLGSLQKYLDFLIKSVYLSKIKLIHDSIWFEELH